MIELALARTPPMTLHHVSTLSILHKKAIKSTFDKQNVKKKMNVRVGEAVLIGDSAAEASVDAHSDGYTLSKVSV